MFISLYQTIITCRKPQKNPELLTRSVGSRPMSPSKSPSVCFFWLFFFKKYTQIPTWEDLMIYVQRIAWSVFSTACFLKSPVFSCIFFKYLVKLSFCFLAKPLTRYLPGHATLLFVHTFVSFVSHTHRTQLNTTLIDRNLWHRSIAFSSFVVLVKK